MPPPHTAPARAVLSQLLSAVRLVGPAVFPRRSAAHGASVGGHVRHALDHYRLLLAGASAIAEAPGPAPLVDYDTRSRGGAEETDAHAAAAAIERVLGELEGGRPGPPGAAVRVRFASPEGGADGTGDVVVESTVGRELAFVWHHAVHHLAMVRLIAAEAGVELPRDLGKAPSTLRYERVSPPNDS
mmetsp:Transcript_6551/g.22111  ORF Transcript_6551/g.22111 Transcript_6551/m.22111 type:complete len:186 (-) Transcript_6551:157-714(-)